MCNSEVQESTIFVHEGQRKLERDIKQSLVTSALIMILKETSCGYKIPVLPIYKTKIFAVKRPTVTLIALYRLVHLTVSGCISVLSNWYSCILSQHYRKETAQKDKGPDLANPELLNNLKIKQQQN